MSGLKIKCYYDCGECAHREGGMCRLYDRPCEEVHIDLYKEDGEE